MTTPTPRTPRVCAWCGAELHGALWRRYCSNACKQAAYRARKARKAARQGEAEALRVSVTLDRYE